MKRRHYVNLTNGVGFLTTLGFKADVFMRLSSTDCDVRVWSPTRLDGDYRQARCILYRYVRGDE